MSNNNNNNNGLISVTIDCKTSYPYSTVRQFCVYSFSKLWSVPHKATSEEHELKIKITAEVIH